MTKKINLITNPLPPDSSPSESGMSIIDQIQQSMVVRAAQAPQGEEEDDEVGVIARVHTPNWRKKVLERYAEGDVAGMINEAAPVAQLSMIEMATEGSDEKVRQKASEYILAQAGHGGITKVENTMKYESLPEDQITAMIISKIHKIGRARPEMLGKVKEGLVTIPAEAIPVPLQEEDDE